MAEKIYKAFILSFIPTASEFFDFKEELMNILKNVKSFGLPPFLFRLLLFFMDIMLSLFALKIKPFHTLNEEKRKKVLEKLEGHPLLAGRFLYIFFKGLVVISFYSSPLGRDFVGYKTECALKES